jgi:hypothetical protein
MAEGTARRPENGKGTLIAAIIGESLPLSAYPLLRGTGRLEIALQLGAVGRLAESGEGRKIDRRSPHHDPWNVAAADS